MKTIYVVCTALLFATVTTVSADEVGPTSGPGANSGGPATQATAPAGPALTPAPSTTPVPPPIVRRALDPNLHAAIAACLNDMPHVAAAPPFMRVDLHQRRNAVLPGPKEKQEWMVGIECRDGAAEELFKTLGAEREKFLDAKPQVQFLRSFSNEPGASFCTREVRDEQGKETSFYLCFIRFEVDQEIVKKIVLQ